jgi:hypothetical protein
VSPLKLGKTAAPKKPVPKKKESPKETTEQIRARAVKKKPRERTASENAAMPATPPKATGKKPNPFTAKAKRVKKPSAWSKKPKATEAPSAPPKKPNAFTARAKQPNNAKLDFTNDGVRFHNCRQRGSYWTVDVTNGEVTVTLQNRSSSWMTLPDDQGRMKEPASWVAAACQRRWIEELKARGLPTPDQRRIQREEEEIKARAAAKRSKKKDDEEE